VITFCFKNFACLSSVLLDLVRSLP